MDAIGEGIENVGLAQEIQKGLSKALQKPPPFATWQAEIDAKKAEFSAMSMADIHKMRLGKNIAHQWAEDTGGDAMSDAFKTSPAIDALAKYYVCCDKVHAEPVSGKQFEELRPLGKGAFGAVFLTFKKDTGAPFAVKKCVKTIAK